MSIDRLELDAMRREWNEINVDILDNEKQTQFKKRKQAVDMYIDGLSLKEIKETTNIPKNETLRLIHKCIRQNKDGQIMGYKALIPYTYDKLKGGKIEQLFQKYSELESFISGNYYGDKKYTLEHNMTVRTLHHKFCKECKRLGIQEYEFPFNIKDKGYYTLNNYVKNVLVAQNQRTIIRENKNAIQKFYSTGYGYSNSIIPIFPYDIVQLDGHKIDILYTVEVVNSNGEIVSMTATRMWLIAVIDVATRAILGYSLTANENYNQTDVLNAIRNSIMPHKRIEYKRHNFTYPENGGFPSEYLEECKWGIFDTIMLDNAKAHLAQNVVKKITSDLTCTVNFGSVATPETRGIVERFFGTLETGGFHRLPGTTGSSISDNKRKDPEKESVRYNITYEDIEEMMEFFIAEYNNSAHSSLENQTPLQVMESKIKSARLLPHVANPNEVASVRKLTNFLVERTIRGGYTSGRRPHISYLGVIYHAMDVQLDIGLVGQKAFIEVDPEDVSFVKLFDTSGQQLSTLIATGEWGRHPHSLKTRELALKRKNANKEQNTPFTPHLTNLEEELRANAEKSRRARSKADIIRKESGKPKLSEETITTPKKADIIQADERRNKGLTDEQKQYLRSHSLIEAYENGIIKYE